MARAITDDERACARALLQRARAAMAAIDDYDQVTVDRLCQAIAWATANEQTFGRLTRTVWVACPSQPCGTRSTPL